MIYIIIAIAVFVLDFVTKLIAVNNLMPLKSVSIINNLLDFTYVENRGIAFGLFGGGRLIFIIVSVIIIALILWILFSTQKEKRTLPLKLGSALVISGAVGNLVERVFKGYVVDFIDVNIFNFPVFNIADIAVCVGAAFLVFYFVFQDKKTEDSADE